jgi:hypothetical protein
MKELIRTDNAVMLSLLEVRLEDAGIKCVVLDRHTASAYGGAISSVLARLMVNEDDVAAAEKIMAQIESEADAASDDPEP